MGGIEELRKLLREEIRRQGEKAEQLEECQRLRREAEKLAQHHAERANKAEGQVVQMAAFVARLLLTSG